MRRGSGLVAPAILVAVGVVALLANTGAISTAGLERLANLWPLILIVFGVELVLRGVTNPVTAGRAGLVVVVVTAAAAVVYATVGPAQLAGERTADFSAPVGGVEHARLVLEFGGADVSVRLGAADDTSLYQAHVTFTGNQNATADFNRSSGTVTIALQEQGLQLGGHRRIDVTLARAVRWTVQLSGGASRAGLDFTGGRLAMLEVSGGATNSDVVLPVPDAPATLSFSGGANTVAVHRPAGVEVRADVTGGASTLRGDGVTRSGVGDIAWQSSGYDSAVNRYTVTVSGGANHLAIDTRG